MKNESQTQRPWWVPIASIIMALLVMATSLMAPQVLSFAKYVSNESAGVVKLSINHAHAILTTGFRLNAAIQNGNFNNVQSDRTKVPENHSITAVYFGTPDEYASQIAGKTGLDVSYYGDGSINLYKNGSSVYIVSDRTIATCSDFSNVFNNLRALKTVKFSSDFDTSRSTTFAYLFMNARSLASVNVGMFNTANATTMQSMFNLHSDSTSTEKNTVLTTLDVSGFNTAKVTDMGSMFRGCSAVTNLDVSGFNTSNVTDMGGMFATCEGLSSLDLTSFDTSKVTTMEIMFMGMKLTALDLRSFTSESLIRANRMFEACSNLTTIYADYDFDLRGNSTDKENADGTITYDSKFANMFLGCKSLVGGSGTAYDASETEYLNNQRAVVDVRLAVEQTVFQSTVGYFTHYTGATPGSTYITTGQKFNAAIKTLANGSSKAYSFEDNAIKKIIFGKTGSVSVDNLKSVNVDNENNGTIKAYWRPSDGAILVLSNSTMCFNSSSDYMFDNLRSVTSIEFANISTSAVRTMQRMFGYAEKLTSIDMSLFETQNVVDYGSCFRNCASFTTNLIESNIIPYINTAKARDIGGLFEFNTSLTGTVHLSDFDTGKCETIASLFQGCTGITAVDISSFTVGPNLTNIGNMFSDCTNLKTIYTNADFNLNIAQITDHNSVFLNSTNLVGGNGTGTKYDKNKVNKEYARPDVAGSPGYFTVVNAQTLSLRSVAFMTMAPAVSDSDMVSDTDIADVTVSGSDIISESTTVTTSDSDISVTSESSTTALTSETTVTTTAATTATTTAATSASATVTTSASSDSTTATTVPVSSGDMTSAVSSTTAVSETSGTSSSRSSTIETTSTTTVSTESTSETSSDETTAKTTESTAASSSETSAATTSNVSETTTKAAETTTAATTSAATTAATTVKTTAAATAATTAATTVKTTVKTTTTVAATTAKTTATAAPQPEE